MISDELKDAILKFRSDRDWEKFHNPKNLSMAIAIEAAELMEPFRWSSDSENAEVAGASAQALADEIADLLILLTYLANDLSINVEQAVAAKLATNAVKYPIARFRGSNKKYSDPTAL